MQQATGDVVIVLEGTYTGTGNRDLDPDGKAITIRSTDPDDWAVVESTIIDSQGDPCDRHRGFYIHSGEDANTVISGFTITGGYAPLEPNGPLSALSAGGAIFCDGSDPVISSCIISKNLAIDMQDAERGEGGGIACRNYANLTIHNCKITSNYSGFMGGGICISINSNPIVSQCEIVGNIAREEGGGMWVFDNSDPSIINSIIVGNYGYGGNGGGGRDVH